MNQAAAETCFLSRQDLQARWGVSESTVDRVLRKHAHQLPAVRLGRSVRIRLRDVEHFESRSRAFRPAVAARS